MLGMHCFPQIKKYPTLEEKIVSQHTIVYYSTLSVALFSFYGGVVTAQSQFYPYKIIDTKSDNFPGYFAKAT